MKLDKLLLENKVDIFINEIGEMIHQPSIKDVSFELREGEILGVAGLVGAKRTEIVETIFGLRDKSAGEIVLHGRHINIKNPIEAIQHGFALITEERRATGIFGKLDINFNSTISNLGKYLGKLTGL